MNWQTQKRTVVVVTVVVVVVAGPPVRPRQLHAEDMLAGGYLESPVGVAFRFLFGGVVAV